MLDKKAWMYFVITPLCRLEIDPFCRENENITKIQTRVRIGKISLICFRALTIGSLSVVMV